MNRKINIYTSSSLYSSPSGPVSEVIKALRILYDTNSPSEYYSNSPEFITTMVHIGRKLHININLYLDGTRCSMQKILPVIHKSITKIKNNIT